MSHNYLNKNRTQELINTIRGHLSDIATVLSNLASGDARDSTKVSLSGDNVTGDIDFYDSGVGFYPDSGHLNGVHGAGGTMWVAFNEAGDTMYVGVLGSNSKRITIDSTGIYINGYKIATLNDIPSAAVSGVKGDTETDYRTGNVNITAANIGAVRYDTSSQGLTATQKSNARTNLGLGSAATHSSNSFATSTQGGYATNFNSNFKPIFTTSGQSHASVFRGKYLGSSFTSAQKTAIANGTFDDLYVGDYWTINNINWRIADINYFKKSTFTTNHLVIMPDTSLYLARMNSSNTTTGGYANSEMWTTNLATALTAIQNAFGSSYIAQFVGTFNNAVSNGIASGYAKTTVQCAIPTASMIWGSSAKYSNYSDFNSGTGKAQLSLFAHNKALIPSQDGYNYWLSDVASANAFNLCNGNAVMDAAGASLATAVYVRPYFCLKGA